MPVARRPRAAALVVLLARISAAVLLAACAGGWPGGGLAFAEKERGGLIRGLIHTISPGSPEDLEMQAREARDISAALDLYGTLESRHGSRPEGVRAAIWLGLYYYGQGDPETALGHFEHARTEARGPVLEAKANFWCDQARLVTGREPLPDEGAESDHGFWGTLRRLTRVDRAIQGERRGEAEQMLLSIEGDARRAGLLGPQIARWGELLQSPAPGGRTNWDVMSPMLRATAELPERVHIEAPAPAAVPPPAKESWSVQFGAFLDSDNAEVLRRGLESKGLKVRIDEGEEEGRHWYRVRLDESLQRDAADSLCHMLQQAGGSPCQIVRLD